MRNEGSANFHTSLDFDYWLSGGKLIAALATNHYVHSLIGLLQGPRIQSYHEQPPVRQLLVIGVRKLFRTYLLVFVKPKFGWVENGRHGRILIWIDAREVCKCSCLGREQVDIIDLLFPTLCATLAARSSAHALNPNEYGA